MNKSVLDFISVALTVVGAGLTIVSGRIDSKMMDIKIEEKVAETIAKQLKSEV